MYFIDDLPKMSRWTEGRLQRTGGSFWEESTFGHEHLYSLGSSVSSGQVVHALCHLYLPRWAAKNVPRAAGKFGCTQSKAWLDANAPVKGSLMRLELLREKRRE